MGSHESEERFYPAIVTFLGYNPLPKPETPGQAIRFARISLGYSVGSLARVAGVDQLSVSRMEADRPGIQRKPFEKVQRFLESKIRGIGSN